MKSSISQLTYSFAIIAVLKDTRVLAYPRTNDDFCLSFQQYPVGDGHNINNGMCAAGGFGDTLRLQEKAPSRGMRYLVKYITR